MKLKSPEICSTADVLRKVIRMRLGCSTEVSEEKCVASDSDTNLVHNGKL